MCLKKCVQHCVQCATTLCTMRHNIVSIFYFALFQFILPFPFAFIEQHYGIMHTLDFNEAVESVALYCRKTGGLL